MKKVFLGFLVLLILIPITLYTVKNNVVGGLFKISKNKVNNLPKASMVFGFPDNMDFIKAKDASENLGKNAFYYDYNPHGLTGSEWVYTKKVYSDSEYKNAVTDFINYYNAKVKEGWVNEFTLDGHNVQTVAKDSSAGRLYGFIKDLNGDLQEILFYHHKDNSNYPANVQFKVFLSDSKPLGEVVK